MHGGMATGHCALPLPGRAAGPSRPGQQPGSCSGLISIAGRSTRRRRSAAAAAAASDGSSNSGELAAEALEDLHASLVSHTADAASMHAAEVEAHAFISHQQPQGGMMPLSHQFGPVGGGGGGPFLVAPLGSGGGWIWAAAVLLAARIGRVTAQEARMDVRQLQFERESSRALSKELVAARERWRSTEAERAAAEDLRRVEEAAAKARQEVQRQREEQRKYQEAAAREAERLRQERDVQRKQYEGQQAKLDAEVAARAEQERLIIEQQRAAARAAEDQRRREEEQRRLKLEEERRQREEQEQRAREEAIRQKIEERRRLEREKKKFAMRLEGSLTVERPPKGTLLPVPLQKEASVRLTASCSTLLGGSPVPVSADYANLADASEALPQLAGAACRLAAESYCSAMRLQSMAGEGVLQWIDDTELEHWGFAAAARAAVAAVAVGDPALQRFKEGGSAASQPVIFQCRTELGVLPADHPQRTDTLLRRLIACIENGEGGAADRLLEDMLQSEVELFLKDLPPCQLLLAPSSSALGVAVLLSHLLSRALAERPFNSSDAPAWFEATAKLARRKLQDATASAPKDSLQLPARIIAAVLGSGNPVAEELSRLAERNMSLGAKSEKQERERRLAAELAAKLVEEEWPDAAETKAARVAEREAKTPVPERCWALRNVAGTLSMGGPGERARARQLLEQAVLLKQQYAGAPDHPGVLPELLPLVNLLAADLDWQRDAAGVAALSMSCLSKVAGAYQQKGDPVSAAILLEASLRKFEELAGVRHPVVKAAMRAADSALDSLTAEQRSTVSAARQQYEACVSKVVGALTDELGAYQQGSPVTKVQRWDGEGVALIGPLH